MLFGARRSKLVPLVYQSFNWQHGTFLGATLASETTAAATGAVGRRAARSDGDAAVLRLQHGRLLGRTGCRWASARPIRQKFSASIGSSATNSGRFLWPGFGENLRVLALGHRALERAAARPTRRRSVTCLKRQSFNGEGSNVSKSDVDQFVAVDREGWKNNLKSQGDYFDTFGDHLPAGIKGRARCAGEPAQRLNQRRYLWRVDITILAVCRAAGPIDQGRARAFRLGDTRGRGQSGARRQRHQAHR